VLNGSRRKRIANGSGTRVQDVNRLLKQYRGMRKMMKSMKGSGLLKRALSGGFGGGGGGLGGGRGGDMPFGGGF